MSAGMWRLSERHRQMSEQEAEPAAVLSTIKESRLVYFLIFNYHTK